MKTLSVLKINGKIRTPSATPSAMVPQEHGGCRDCQTCTPQNIPVIYAPAGREVDAVQRMSVPGRQFSLYDWLTIGKLPQPRTYAGPYCTNYHDQRELSHRGGPSIRTNPLLCHRPGYLSPRRKSVLDQCPPERIQVACFTGPH